MKYIHRQTKKSDKGQTITEYAVFITVVVMALAAMQIYIKRGVQGKLFDMTSAISTDLYTPSSGTSSIESSRRLRTQSDYDGGVTTMIILEDQTNRTGTEVAMPETVPGP